ncbi:hypothetical protein P7C70_g735, partial [Phenoliferia sp. Uapishka_3]
MSSADASTTKPPRKVGKAIADAIARGAPNVELSRLPDLTDMTAETLTENVIKINSLCEDPRLKFVMERAVTHLHAFAKEVGLTTEEWMATIQFLTATGKICSDIRQEFILLSDILGLSALVDTMNHPVPAGSEATEATVLGPFFTEDSHDIPAGESIASEGKGEYMYVQGYVKDLQGKGIEGCTVETWETDEDGEYILKELRSGPRMTLSSSGLYDTQYDGRSQPDCRGRLTTDKDGKYCYRAVLPVAYPIPNDGPVGTFLRKLNRHVFRPAHLHMQFAAKGFEPLTTALYFTGDDYLKSDAVFGVKSSLVCDVKEITDEASAKALGFRHAPYYLLDRDFVLITTEEAEIEKRKSLANYYASLQAK